MARLSNLFKQDKEKFVVPRGVQDVIPITAIYDDGIFQVGKDKFSRTFKFSDINYAVASREDSEIPMPAFESSEAMLQMEQEPEPEAEKEVDTDDKEVLLRLLAKPEMAELVKSLAANL